MGDIFLVPTQHHLNATVYPSIVADHVHLLTITHLLRATSSRTMNHVTKIKSSPTGFLNMKMTGRGGAGFIIDVQPTNLQQLHNAIMPIWTKLSEECFQELLESMTQTIKAVLKAKGGPTRY